MICWQSWIPSDSLFSMDRKARMAPYLPNEAGKGLTGAGCVQPASLTSGWTLTQSARLTPIFSPTFPIVRAEWSPSDFPSNAGKAFSASASSIALFIKSVAGISVALFKTADTTVSARPWKVLFRATKSVSQLISTTAPWFLSIITAMRPWAVVLPWSFSALDQPSACACSFNHASA